MSHTTMTHVCPPNFNVRDAGVRPAARDRVRTIRVTQISTTDLRGGAARAAHRLHRTLGQEGVSSRMLVAQRFGDDPDVVEYNPFAPAPAFVGRAFFRLSRRLHRPSVSKAGAYFSLDWTLIGWRLLSQVPACDVVNLHWVADLLDYRSLPQIAARHPIIWTFHDMNAFTGGCHYSGLCERFVDRCGSCPQLMTTTNDVDMTRRVLRRKQDVLARIPPSRLMAVSPSHWLAREARRSALFRNFEVRVIPNGINLQEYRPMDRAEARRRLNLPLDARIVLFVAEQIADRRKGLRLLLKAFQAIQEIPGLLLVTLGRGGYEAIPPLRSQHLGSLDDSEDLRAAYSAADAFAMPSLQDNLPNTILESMACGTPVVGFSAGGIGEAVVSGKTGLLAPTGDFSALASSLRCLLEDQNLQRMLSANARQHVEQEYSIELQARRYAALYREVSRRADPGGEIFETSSAPVAT
jgi:glycosyltransferase involved in cell wall biosynthesis